MITKTTAMMNMLEHFNEIHSLEMSDQIILDRNDSFSPKKTMEKLKRNKTELYYYTSTWRKSKMEFIHMIANLTKGVES